MENRLEKSKSSAAMTNRPIWRVRLANPADGEAIAALFRSTYGITTPGNRDDEYPFQQFMRGKVHADSIANGDAFWVVAEANQQVIGCFGAQRNIGRADTDDLVAEQMGLIVSERWRRRGIGKRLMGEMCDRLDRTAHFIIAEARTADPGGWIVARAHGFVPIGFEPIAHRVEGRHESMLVLAKLDSESLEKRLTNHSTTACVHRLASVVAPLFQIDCLPKSDQTPYSMSLQDWTDARKVLVPADSKFGISLLAIEAGGVPTVGIIDKETFEGWRGHWKDTPPHNSGVIGLNRLEGEDPKGERYENLYLCVTLDGKPLALARVSLDHLDRRARILFLESKFHGLQGLILAKATQILEQRDGSNSSVSIVIDVRADFLRLQSTLEQLGFFPTVYYPALISVTNEDGHAGRVDGIQFTRILVEDAHASSHELYLEDKSREIMNTVLSACG